MADARNSCLPAITFDFAARDVRGMLAAGHSAAFEPEQCCSTNMCTFQFQYFPATYRSGTARFMPTSGQRCASSTMTWRGRPPQRDATARSCQGRWVPLRRLSPRKACRHPRGDLITRRVLAARPLMCENVRIGRLLDPGLSHAINRISTKRRMNQLSAECQPDQRELLKSSRGRYHAFGCRSHLDVGTITVGALPPASRRWWNVIKLARASSDRRSHRAAPFRASGRLPTIRISQPAADRALPAPAGRRGAVDRCECRANHPRAMRREGSRSSGSAPPADRPPPVVAARQYVRAGGGPNYPLVHKLIMTASLPGVLPPDDARTPLPRARASPTTPRLNSKLARDFEQRNMFRRLSRSFRRAFARRAPRRTDRSAASASARRALPHAGTRATKPRSRC